MKREILRAEVHGFCMGVKEAVRKVREASEDETAPQPVVTYGPLIHNRLVMDELAERNVGVVNAPEDVQGGTVIIRAHGVPVEVHRELEKRAERLVDGTCPRVRQSMKLVRRHAQAGGHVILVGDRQHGEIKAVASHADSIDIVATPEDAAQARVPDGSLVIAQTTIALGEYERICSVLRERNEAIKIVRSICPATKERQSSLREIAERCEAVVVVGGRNSSNTKRLYQLALEMDKPAWHIEEAAEVPGELAEYRCIALTAGASTPDWVIDEVEEALKAL